MPKDESNQDVLQQGMEKQIVVRPDNRILFNDIKK